MTSTDTLRSILDLARWAPSGDNTQPWRFEIINDKHIAIHGHDTRDWCVYDFQGRASHIAHGALLETIRIAATQYKLKAAWEHRAGTPDTAPIYDIRFTPDIALDTDPLYPFIKTRTVQRRPMKLIPLTVEQRNALNAAAGKNYSIQLYETLPERYKIAKLLWQNAHIRLTCPEAYQVHKKMIEWNARFSIDRIPERAIGVDPITAKLMHWVMQSWERLNFFNRYLLGTIAPRIQLDLIPAIFCAAHLLIKAEKAPQTLANFVEVGSVMQRVWLTCTANKLLLQPEMTPLIFGWYTNKAIQISCIDEINHAANRLADHVHNLFGIKTKQPVFLCRIGTAPQPDSRSVRMALDDLMWHAK